MQETPKSLQFESCIYVSAYNSPNILKSHTLILPDREDEMNVFPSLHHFIPVIESLLQPLELVASTQDFIFVSKTLIVPSSKPPKTILINS